MQANGKYIKIAIIILLITCPGFIISCNQSNYGFDGLDENQDNIRPAAIYDLEVIEVNPTSVRLRWTATGDDGDSGTAAQYSMKYYEQTISDENWENAHTVHGIPDPSPAGAIDSAIVTGLLEDSTYYFAIKVKDDTSNWSNLSNIVMAVCFNDFEINIPDTIFERIIRFRIAKPTGPILRSDLFYIETFNANNQHIHDLTGIEYCVNLRQLLLWNNNINDLTPLTGLLKLKTLKIGFNGLSDINPLTSLTQLDTLHLNANSISDITALENLTNLSELNLTANAIWNTAPLAGKTTIRNLYLDENQIVFVNPLYNMTGLEKLLLINNRIEDLLPLAYNQGLSSGDTIWITGNPLSAASTDSILAVIRNRGVVVIQ